MNLKTHRFSSSQLWNRRKLIANPQHYKYNNSQWNKPWITQTTSTTELAVWVLKTRRWWAEWRVSTDDSLQPYVKHLNRHYQPQGAGNLSKSSFLSFHQVLTFSFLLLRFRRLQEAPVDSSPAKAKLSTTPKDTSFMTEEKLKKIYMPKRIEF